ncbi:MAG: hypothetical protein FJ037_02860 [Chloroflexi bacterium]|nr:hypothetical protein [Chloroflexota bacterium]
MEFTDEQRQYLEGHQLAVLGTGKRDGSPQLSMVNYRFDRAHILISVTSDRAKWTNTRRQPKVALLIPDGRKQLVIYGTGRLAGRLGRSGCAPSESNPGPKRARSAEDSDMPGIRKIGRDARNGEFIAVKEAKSRPTTTTVETLKNPKR